MKYPFDVYDLYNVSSLAKFTMRIQVRMKEPVDGETLYNAMQKVMTRYPYFAVRLGLDVHGGYTLKPNSAPLVVMTTTRPLPNLGGSEVNGHLAFVDFNDCDIYFNMSHTLAGGKGIMPWVITSVWQYVADRYGVEVDVPGLRRPGSPLLPGEESFPTLETLPQGQPLPAARREKVHVLAKDYLNGLYNPFRSSLEYFVFTFDRDEIIRLAKGNDNSVNSLFMVLMFKTMDKVLPRRVKRIGAETAHNPAASLGMPNAHGNLLTHALVSYNREMAGWDLEKLGTITRSAVYLQTDLDYCVEELRRALEHREKLDEVEGQTKKLLFAKDNNPHTGKGAMHGTYQINYTGQLEWGGLTDYADRCVAIVDGHQLLEIMSMGDKIFVSVMQMVRTDKYIRALEEVLREQGISYQLEGPFPKNMAIHALPTEIREKN